MLPVERVAPLQILNGQLAGRANMLGVAEMPYLVAGFKCGRGEQVQNAEYGIAAEQPLQGTKRDVQRVQPAPARP